MFQFRLQSLLQHRKYLEDNCQKSLARVQSELKSETRSLNALYSRKTVQQQKLQQIQATVHTAAQIQPHQAYLNCLDRDIDQLRQRIGKLKENVAGEHRKLMEAVKSRKLLERLKETERSRYHRKRLKKEQDMMNEVATHRYIRNQSN